MLLLPLLALVGDAVATDYCDGSGGITHSYRDRSDASCMDYCTNCSAEQVVAAMVAAPDGLYDRGVQMYGCDALRTKANNSPANQAAIAEAGGIEAVTSAMSRFPDDDDMQQFGCYALGSLAADSPANREAIAEAGGIDAVTGAMSRLPEDRWVQIRGCEALANMATDNPTNGAAIRAAGGAAAVAAAMDGPLEAFDWTSWGFDRDWCQDALDASIPAVCPACMQGPDGRCGSNSCEVSDEPWGAALAACGCHGDLTDPACQLAITITECPEIHCKADATPKCAQAIQVWALAYRTCPNAMECRSDPNYIVSQRASANCLGPIPGS